MNDRRFIDRLTAPLVHFMERYYPDLFLFIFIITFITFFSVWWFAGYQPRQIFLSWGSSLSDILAFSMQMALMAMISHFLAHYGICLRLLYRQTALGCGPEDIAHTMLFLASPEASYITGRTIVVDGGSTLLESQVVMDGFYDQ